MDTGPREMAVMDAASGKDPAVGILKEIVVEAHHRFVLNDTFVDNATIINTFLQQR